MHDATVSSMPCAREYWVNAQGMVVAGAADHTGDDASLTRLLVSSRPLATGCILHTGGPLRGCAAPASLADVL
jgi:hypothetical protein